MKKNLLISIILIVCLVIGIVALVACGSGYTITINATEHGSITADKTSANEGDTVTMTVTPDKGWHLVKGSLKMNDTAIDGDSFTMPAANVVITAEFAEGEDTSADVPVLNLDNAFKAITGNSGTMVLEAGGSRMIGYRTPECLKVMMEEYIDSGDFDEYLYFKYDGKFYSYSEKEQQKMYLEEDFKYRMQDYYNVIMAYSLFENAGSYFIKQGDNFVVDPNKYNEYYDAQVEAGHILNVLYSSNGEPDTERYRTEIVKVIKSLKIQFKNDKEMFLKLTLDETDYSAHFYNIGSTYVIVPENVYNMPLTTLLNYYSVVNGVRVDSGYFYATENQEYNIVDFEKNLPKGYRIKGVYYDRELTKPVTLPYKIKAGYGDNLNPDMYFDVEYIGIDVEIYTNNSVYRYTYIEGETVTFDTIKSFIYDKYRREITKLYTDSEKTIEFTDYANFGEYIINNNLYADTI